MKRFLSLLSFAIFALVATSSAQSLRYGVMGAMNLSNYAMSDNGVSFDADSRVGFKAGFQMEWNADFITEGAYFDFGALISSRGAKLSSSVGDISVDWTSRPYYLEIPMHIGYSVNLGASDRVSLFASFGPYIAVGLWGTDKVVVASEKSNPDTFSDDSLKRFDFGLGLKGGVRLFDNYRVYIGYDWGLLNVAQSSGFKINNRNFYVGAAYMF
ncbi:MAG: PorT family protein [Alistipes sp.]|nr:PorT family protein [Alistipes sp.]